MDKTYQVPNGTTPITIDDPLITADDGAAILNVSTATFWRRVADGTVPQPLKLGSLSRWPKSEIAAVIEKAKAARTAGGGRG